MKKFNIDLKNSKLNIYNPSNNSDVIQGDKISMYNYPESESKLFTYFYCQRGDGSYWYVEVATCDIYVTMDIPKHGHNAEWIHNIFHVKVDKPIGNTKEMLKACVAVKEYFKGRRVVRRVKVNAS